MILVDGTTDLLRVITSSTATVDVHATYVDDNGTTRTPGRTNTLLSSIATTTVVAAPGSGVHRSVKTVTIRNRHASTACDVTVIHSDGTNVPELVKATLNAGDSLHYDEHQGWTARDNLCRVKERDDNLLASASPDFTTVVLGSDQTNNNATANTIADVTGLSFSVTAGSTYWFRFLVMYTAAATTTGSRWSVNGPASPTLLIFRSEYSLSGTTQTLNAGLSAYDTPAASSASSAATGSNIAKVEGFITPSASGTVILRFASEVSASAIVAKAGSILHWQQVL